MTPLNSRKREAGDHPFPKIKLSKNSYGVKGIGERKKFPHTLQMGSLNAFGCGEVNKREKLGGCFKE